MSSNYLDSLTEEQLDIVLEYRKNAQRQTAELLNKLADSKHDNASLVVLSETTAIVADVIYVAQVFGNNPLNLYLNNCKSIDDFRELLFIFAIQNMMEVVKQYISLNPSSETNITEEDIKAAKSAIKH